MAPQAQNAAAGCDVLLACLRNRWDLPHVGHRQQIVAVAQVIIAGELRFNAIDGAQSRPVILPRLGFFPAIATITGSWPVLGWICRARPFALHILALGFVHGAKAGVGRQHGNVDPRRGVPVGVVVSFFGALKTAAVSVGILTSIYGGVSVQVLVCGEKALVALSRLAAGVVTGVFVQAGCLVGVLLVGRGGGRAVT